MRAAFLITDRFSSLLYLYETALNDPIEGMAVLALERLWRFQEREKASNSSNRDVRRAQHAYRIAKRLAAKRDNPPLLLGYDPNVRQGKAA